MCMLLQVHDFVHVRLTRPFIKFKNLENNVSYYNPKCSASFVNNLMENMHEISITAKKPVNRQNFHERLLFGLTKRTTFFEHKNHRCVDSFHRKYNCRILQWNNYKQCMNI